MEYRRLGNSGLMVSPVCLGAMMFGGPTDAKAAASIIASARDAGVNFIDTADVYIKGESEKVTGKIIRRDRDKWVLATKVGNPMSDDPNERGLGRKWMERALDDSLSRLGTDYVDIYYLHRDDPGIRLEETLETLADLISAGKVRHWAFSNFRAWRVVEMVGLCERMGIPKPVAGQPYYNAVNRLPEIEYLPACAHFGIGVVPYSPLARGVLTGKYGTTLKATKGTRAGRKDPRMMETEWRKESLIIAQKIKKHASRRGMTAGQFVFNWVLNNQLVTSVLAGPRTLGHWKDYLAALDHEFTGPDETFMNKLVPPGHPSTPGYTDPKYPVLGRVPRTD